MSVSRLNCRRSFPPQHTDLVIDTARQHWNGQECRKRTRIAKNEGVLPAKEGRMVEQGNEAFGKA